jgi:mRNA-degrading endonuclease RelE of RelBE toxin-antitoxin system
MAEVKISSVFFESANRLPKDARAKLFKIFDLLTNNPRHPSLHLKKIQGSVRDDIYECRIDLFWRLILQDLGDMLFQAIYVGAHDEAINHGAMIRESTRLFYTIQTDPADLVHSYLSGEDIALSFKQISLEILGATLDVIEE